jgi:hypothetical protein
MVEPIVLPVETSANDVELVEFLARRWFVARLVSDHAGSRVEVPAWVDHRGMVFAAVSLAFARSARPLDPYVGAAQIHAWHRLSGR